MELERVAAVIRPRSAWEAADLGLVLVRRFWRPVWAAWCAFALPPCLLLVVLLRDHLLWALFLVWLLKPVLERVPLFVLSRALFGATPRLGEVGRALPGLFGGHLVSALTIYRLHPARSFLLPIPELEQMRGAARLRRERVLNRRSTAEAILLTFSCLVFELAAAVSLAALVLLFLPEDRLERMALSFSDLDSDVIARHFGWIRFCLFGFWLAAVSLITPFYVAGGFGLYLNRRSHLEGWDIELAFRRLARRVEGASRSRIARSAGAIALLLCALVGLAGGPSAGQEPPPDPDPATVATEVLAHQDFGSEVVKEGWRAKERDPGREPWDFSTLGGILAILLEVVFWLVVAAIAVLALTWIAKQAGWIRLRRKDEGEAAPTTAFGLDIRPESLPEDVAGEARRLWRDGRTTAAMGLLYRAAIARLIEVDGLVLEESDTERDCLRRVEGLSNRDKAGFFGEVTGAWQTCAYARRQPEDAVAEGLFERFGAFFGGAR